MRVSAARCQADWLSITTWVTCRLDQPLKTEWVTYTDDETRAIGEAVGRHLRPGDVLCLEGPLGAGKTSFAQGVARGLGVEEVVNSPTFTLVQEYAGRLPVYHLDVYRLSGP